MAIFNNRYYPDSRLITWANTSAYTWEQSDQNWLTVNSTSNVSSLTWSYTSDATDLGSIKSFYPTTEVDWDTTSPVTIEYLYSSDGNAYTTVSPGGSITARYLKTQITTAGSFLSSINTNINYTPITETYYNLDTTTLSGNTTHRRLNANRFSTVQSITITSAVSETRPIQGQLIENQSGNVIIRAINLDSWDKLAVDANVNIVVVGFPYLTTDANVGVVYASR
jgi:hypothetical protein